MGFMEAVKTVFSKYAVFSGRARRSEYWYFTLFNLIAAIVLGFIGNMIWGTDHTNYLASAYGLVSFVPSIAVGFRRLHDIGKSGLWILIGIIPFIGEIILIIFYVRDSQPGVNQYGPNPKEKLFHPGNYQF